MLGDYLKVSTSGLAKAELGVWFQNKLNMEYETHLKVFLFLFLVAFLESSSVKINNEVEMCSC